MAVTPRQAAMIATMALEEARKVAEAESLVVIQPQKKGNKWS